MYFMRCIKFGTADNISEFLEKIIFFYKNNSYYCFLRFSKLQYTTCKIFNHFSKISSKFKIKFLLSCVVISFRSITSPLIQIIKYFFQYSLKLQSIIIKKSNLKKNVRKCLKNRKFISRIACIHNFSVLIFLLSLHFR